VSSAIVVAVDGPAASGKTTLAQRLAKANGLRFLDTGLLYRAVARRLLQAGRSSADIDSAVAAAASVNADDLDPGGLRAERIGEVASEVAVHRPVRTALLDFQRRFAAEEPGAVLAGRDIGSVVCPDATLKLFVTASPEVRARRRFEELRARGEVAMYEQVLEDVRERDRRDWERAVAPLSVAPDAVCIDTSTLDLDASLAALQQAFDRACAGRSPSP
jgi:cytidylate kinase